MVRKVLTKMAHVHIWCCYIDRHTCVRCIESFSSHFLSSHFPVWLTDTQQLMFFLYATLYSSGNPLIYWNYTSLCYYEESSFASALLDNNKHIKHSIQSSYCKTISLNLWLIANLLLLLHHWSLWDAKTDTANQTICGLISTYDI